MFTDTIIFSGQLVCDGVTFSWWVTEGLKPRMTVSYPYSTQTLPRTDAEPMAQARAVAQAMLARQARLNETALAEDLAVAIPERPSEIDG